jgi:hypothetical protein
MFHGDCHRLYETVARNQQKLNYCREQKINTDYSGPRRDTVKMEMKVNIGAVNVSVDF